MLPLVYTIYIGTLFIALRSKYDFMIIIDSDHIYSNYVYMDTEVNNYDEYNEYNNHDKCKYLTRLDNSQGESDMIYKEKRYHKFLQNPTLIVPCKSCHDTNKINNHDNVHSHEIALYQLIGSIASNVESMHKDKQLVDCSCNINYNVHNDCNKQSKKSTNLVNDQLYIVALFCFLFGLSSSMLFGSCVQMYKVYTKESIDKRLQNIETNAIALINNGNYLEAFNLLQLAIDIIITHKGKSHIDYGTFSHLLAKTKINLGRFKSAEKVLIDVIKMYEPYGEDVHMIEALEDLGLVLKLQGRIDESVLIFSKVNEIAENTKRINCYLASEESNINDIYTKYGIPQYQFTSDAHDEEDINQRNIYGNKINFNVTSDDTSNNFINGKFSNTISDNTLKIAIDTELFNTPLVNNLLMVDSVGTNKYQSISPETIMYEFENI